MFSKKSHIGRPSNKELKKRKIKKVLIIGIPSIVVIAVIAMISSGSLSDLMGNSVVTTGGSYGCPSDIDGTVSGDKCIFYRSSLIGDIDGDGNINSSDSKLLMSELNKEGLTVKQYPWYDVNGDGTINSNDYDVINDVLQSTGTATSDGNLNFDSNVITSETAGITSGNLFNETVIGTKVCPSNEYNTDGKCKVIIDAILVDDETDSQDGEASTNTTTDNTDTTTDNTDTTQSDFSNLKVSDGVAEFVYKFPGNINGNFFYAVDFIGKKGSERVVQCSRVTTPELNVKYKMKESFGKFRVNIYLGICNPRMARLSKETQEIKCNCEFSIKYKSGSNAATGTMADQTIMSGVSTAISKNKFKRSGYEFKGWKVKNKDTGKYICYTSTAHNDVKYLTQSECKYGYKLYKDGQKVSNTVKSTQTAEFIAQWEKVHTATVKKIGTKKTVKKGTKVNTFSIKSDGNYTVYYRKIKYGNGDKVAGSNCKAVGKLKKNVSFEINYKKVYGVVKVYSDKSCTKKIAEYKTNTIKCSNCKNYDDGWRDYEPETDNGWRDYEPDSDDDGWRDYEPETDNGWYDL